MKIVVCQKDFCVFKFMDMGLGLSLSSEIVRCDTMVDMLISFFWYVRHCYASRCHDHISRSAVHGGRVKLFYPTSVRKQQADGSYRSFLLRRAQGNKKRLLGTCP